MKQIKNPLLCVFASMIFLFSCKKETVSVNENETVSAIAKKNEANKMVPFKGTYTTTLEVLTGPPMLLQRITGVGHATHLGASTFVALSTLNLTTAPPFNLSGTAIFTAANGDIFYTSFTGTATPNPDGTRTVVMNHTITGGTGRFDDASGNFTGFSIVNLSSPENTITYEGSISY